MMQAYLQHAALGKARADLQRHGTAGEHVERIERRLEALQRRAAAFDVAADLEECAASWGHLAHDVAALSGPRRDELLRFLAARKDAIDRATAGLSQARNAGGVHPEQRARLRAVEDERERALDRYARLRDDYLRASRGHGTRHPSGALAPVVVTLPELLAPRGLLRSASPRLDAVIERDRHLRIGVAQRFEKTLGSLATANHRTLTDPRAGELREHLARMDGILARLQGKRSASELSDGAREVGGLLAQMGDLASARGSAAALKPFRALLEERRAALARLAGEAQKAAGAQALHQRGALPQPSAIALGEKQLQTLRKLHPGIETLLRDASASQLDAELRRPEAHSPLERAQGRLGSVGLAGVGQAIAGAHLGGFGGARGGGLGALREHGAIGRALGGHRGSEPAHAHARELHELLGTLKKAPPGSPLHQIAIHAEDRRRQIAERAKARLHGRGPARALGEAFHAHGRSDFAAHVAPGGALYHLLQGAQRSHGLPVPHLASHFLQSRGAHPLAGTMQLFDHLRAEGYRPHFGLFSRLKHVASDAFHKATTTIAHTAADAARTASGLAKAAGGTVRSGLSDLGHHALDAGQRVAATVRGAAGKVGHTVGRAAGSGARSLSQALQQGVQFVGREASALRQATGRAVTRVTRTVRDVVHGGIDRVTQLGAAVMQRAGEAGRQVSRFGERALHIGLDALHRTGIAGGIGKGVRFGLSMMKTAASYSPVGLAVQGFRKAGGLQGIWEKTKHTAGAAWQGVQKAYQATAGFLQSPAGQLLVTGLSLAATFIPGGVVVKSIVGGVIGGIQAISEGKDFKHVLLAAGTGALTGALPFLKLGPLAGVGIGALTGAASALASGGRLKAAQKILQGKQLSKMEKLAVERSHLKGPLGGLEKLYSKGVKGGILLSGKAAKAQGYLDKALATGDRLEGGLSLIHQLAPEVADAAGDNALGRLIAQAGGYAGEGDQRLKKALDMGHGASGALQRYRGHVDKGLGYAGVKDPQKAYGRMMARKDARAGKREGIEAVARDKLERHRLRHPELHEDVGAHRPVLLEELGRKPRHHEPRTPLEKALARGKALERQGREVVQGVHDGLQKVQGTVGKGLEYAGRMQGGLEKAAALARQGAGVVGEHSELGAYLSHLADRADQAHGYLEQGTGFARDFNERVGKVGGGLELIPSVRPEGARKKKRKRIGDAPQAEHLQRAAQAEHAEAHPESDEERSRRHKQAWDAIASVSSRVQRFELESSRRLRAAHELGAKEQTGQALQELMALGGQVDEIKRRIEEAKRLARGNEKYEKEIAFYEEWQQKARAKVHAAIAGGKDLGKHVADRGAREFLGDGTQDRLIDESIAKLEKALHPAPAPRPSQKDKGHDKLHGALQLEERGKKGLHQGRQLLEEALHLGAQRHVEKGHQEHARGDGREHAHELSRAPIDAGPDGAQAAPQSKPQAAVEAAAQAVAHFGGAVDGAIKAVQRLLERGRSAEAEERIRSVQELGDHAAAAVKDAAQAAFKDPALTARAAKLRDHLQDLRAHFRQLVSGLKGLDSKHADLEGAEPGRRDGQPRRQPAGRGGRRPQGDMVDEVLRGIDDGRIFVDRGAHRGERPDRDHQEVDSAAIDTWIGSGEGVKLFSEVFGAFLPVEEDGRRGGSQKRRGGRGARDGHKGHGGHKGDGGHPADDQREHPEPGRGKGGFFASMFEKAEDFAESVAHAAHAGAGVLGKAMHHAEMGLHGLNVVEHAAEKVHGLAGKAEAFLYRMHLGSAAGFAHQVGEAAGWVDARAEEAHGGVKTADEYLGEGKHDLEVVESAGQRTANVARRARKGRFGDVLNVFRAAAGGDGIDGKLRPEQVRLGSGFDEPRRLDALTQARMEQFLGGDFTGVRLHVGPGAAQITNRYAAEAVTVKDHIFFAPGKFNPDTVEGQKLLAHELTHVLQKGRKNLDVRTAETEALHAEHSYGTAPAMEPLNLSRPAPDFRLPDGEGAPGSDGIHTAKRTRSRGQDAGSRDEVPDGEEFLEKVSGRVYELLMDELEQSFESR